MLTQLVRLARPQQWLKNGVLMVSLVFAGELTDVAKDKLAIMGTLIFSLLSSAAYTFNDICDYKTDREHPKKKNRPIASGRVSPMAAAIMTLLLLAAGLIGAWYVNRGFFFISLAFVAFNAIYSLLLKHVVIVDVMGVALSFVIRAYAGALAISVPASKWLIANTLLLALFLAFGKRRHELVLLEEGAEAHRKSLSHYSKYLLDQMIGVTTASVVVMYILYTLSSEVSIKLGTPNLYMTIPFVIYGIFRYLYLIHRKDKGGSPTRVLITDVPILLTVVLWLLTSIIILYYL
jgi:4-hydroxybenzoate polyprenyltransferase